MTGAHDPGERRDRPIRHFEPPPTLTGRLWVWRYLIFRRLTQVGILALFFGTVQLGWQIAQRPLLNGNLSSAELLGLVPLADPFAVAQIVLTWNLPATEVLIGAAIVLAAYTVLGGRTWCAWVCPINMVTDLADWLHRRLHIGNAFYLHRRLRYAILALTLLLSALLGVAAFEWISPIGIFHRELIYGLGLGWTALLGVFLFDLLILKHGWCGHLCPLGAFYALVGKAAQLRVRFDAQTCTGCGDCAQVCPEPQVLHLKKAAEAGMVASGECTNCGRCVPICPENSLRFDWRVRIPGADPSTVKTTDQRRAA